jgi:putative efflux protein, MATE family
MIDTYMVSKLGKPAVAAVGVTNQPKFFVFSVFFSINAAISALVARRVGEKKKEDANGLFMTGLYFVILACITLSILCVVFARPFMTLCGASELTIDEAVKYFRIVMGGSIFNLASLYINAAQRGSGNTRIAMTTNVTSNVVNVIMNYLLIEGHFGFPALGVSGAAIATVLGTVVSFIMSILSINRKDSYVQISFIRKNKIRPKKQYVKELTPITSTILGENLFMRFGFMITSAMTARVGVNPYSAHLVGMNLMNVGFAFGDGLRSAMVALVGRSLGEKKPDKAKKYVASAERFGMILSLTCAVLLIFFGKKFFNLYFPGDQEMLGYGFTISLFIAAIMPVQISRIIFNGTLQGAGDVKYTLIASTIGVTVIQPIVLATLMYGFNMKLSGVWISILVSQVAQFILFTLRYFSGKWEKKVI